MSLQLLISLHPFGPFKKISDVANIEYFSFIILFNSSACAQFVISSSSSSYLVLLISYLHLINAVSFNDINV